jgi:hypothetical protein
MNSIDIDALNQYVNEHVGEFHRRKITTLEGLSLRKLLRKNPYLLKANNIITAEQLITALLEARISSSEEELFGEFLEKLAVFVAQQTCNGHKSAAQGIDLEFFNKGIHYVVSIKSGTNWGNSSQQKKLEQDFKDATARLKQINRSANIQPVLGICYGKTKTSHLRGYMKVVGQNFWYLISENKSLYKDIIEPIGYRAQEHNERFMIERGSLINRLVLALLQEFCDPSGAINWPKLVEFNSGNFDLDTL